MLIFPSLKHTDSDVLEKKKKIMKNNYLVMHVVYSYIFKLCQYYMLWNNVGVGICSGQQGINAVNQYECTSYTLSFVQN